MIGIIILWGMTIGTIYFMYKAKIYNRKHINNNIESNIAKSRLCVGSLMGMVCSWILYWICLYIKDLTPSKLNPYIATFPYLGMIPVGIIGATIGSMLSLLSRKWKQ